MNIGTPIENIDVRTEDKWSLRVDVWNPGKGAVGVAVLAHALRANRGDFDHTRGEGLAAFLAMRGWRVVAFDFRGHGESRPAPLDAASVGYDDLVARDLSVVCAFARSRALRARPLVVLGHSLGGHAALAAQGAGTADADAVVGLGASPWLPQLEPSRARWAVKRVLLEAAVTVGRRAGVFPARALGLGSENVARGCLEDLLRFARTADWSSADGRCDYLAALARVRVPVLEVVSEGDRLDCPPACGERLLGYCGGPRDVLRVERADDGGPPPGHMGLVRSPRVRGVWGRIEEWMRAVPVRVATAAS